MPINWNAVTANPKWGGKSEKERFDIQTKYQDEILVPQLRIFGFNQDKIDLVVNQFLIKSNPDVRGMSLAPIPTDSLMIVGSGRPADKEALEGLSMTKANITDWIKQGKFKTHVPEFEELWRAPMALRLMVNFADGATGGVFSPIIHDEPENTTEMWAGKVLEAAGFITGSFGKLLGVGSGVAAKGITAATKGALTRSMIGRGATRAASGAAGFGMVNTLLGDGLLPTEWFDNASITQRLKAGARGAAVGSAFGLSAGITNIVGRVAATATASGLPSTAYGEDIDDQVFNYALGAFFGLKKPQTITPISRKLSKEIAKNIPKDLDPNLVDLRLNLEGQNNSREPATSPQIAKIHAVATEMRWENDQRYVFSAKEVGKRSSLDMTKQEASKLIDAMERVNLERKNAKAESVKLIEEAQGKTPIVDVPAEVPFLNRLDKQWGALEGSLGKQNRISEQRDIINTWRQRLLDGESTEGLPAPRSPFQEAAKSELRKTASRQGVTIIGEQKVIKSPTAEDIVRDVPVPIVGGKEPGVSRYGNKIYFANENLPIPVSSPRIRVLESRQPLASELGQPRRRVDRPIKDVSSIDLTDLVKFKTVVPSVESVDAMPRRELQKRAKQFGIKANQKSEIIRAKLRERFFEIKALEPGKKFSKDDIVFMHSGITPKEILIGAKEFGKTLKGLSERTSAFDPNEVKRLFNRPFKMFEHMVIGQEGNIRARRIFTQTGRILGRADEVTSLAVKSLTKQERSWLGKNGKTWIEGGQQGLDGLTEGLRNYGRQYSKATELMATFADNAGIMVRVPIIEMTPKGVKTTMEHVPFSLRHRKNYFPHTLTTPVRKASLAKKGEVYEALVQFGMGRGIGRDEWAHMTDSRTMTRKFGSLEDPRMRDLPDFLIMKSGKKVQILETDPLTALNSYIAGASQRIATVAEFGGGADVNKRIQNYVDGLVDGIANDPAGGSALAKNMRGMWENVIGKPPSEIDLFLNSFTGELLTAPETLTRGLMLSGSQITNAVGGWYPMFAIGGLRRTAIAMNKVFMDGAPLLRNKDATRQLQRLKELGAWSTDYMKYAEELQGLHGNSIKATRSFLRALGFDWINRQLTKTAAVLGEDMLVESVQKLRLGHKDSAHIARRLNTDFKFYPEEIDRMVGKGITSDDIALASQEMSGRINLFRESPLNVPPVLRTQLGRRVVGLLSFSRSMGGLTADFVAEARAGRPERLIKFVIGGAIATEAIDAVKDFLNDRKNVKGENWFVRLWMDINGSGVFGMYGSWANDLVWANRMEEDPFSSITTPPSWEFQGDFMVNLGRAIRKHDRRAWHRLLKQIPIFKMMEANAERIFVPEQRRQATLDQEAADKAAKRRKNKGKK